MKARSHVRDGLALAFALLFPLFMAWVYFVLVAGDGRRANPAFMLGYAGGKLIQFAFPAAYAYLVARHELRPARPTTRGLGTGAAFAALVAVVAFALYFGKLAGDPRLVTASVKIHGKLREFGLDSPAGFVCAALFLSAAHSLFEEYYWRWFVFGWLKRLLPAGAAAVLSSLGFMAHHVVILATYFPGQFWQLALPLSLCVAAGGLVLAWIYHRSGSLYAAWLSHALLDAAIMAVGYLMLRPGWDA
jgi:membrane protease YdiL (CAAX protease family)